MPKGKTCTDTFYSIHGYVNNYMLIKVRQQKERSFEDNDRYKQKTFI